MRVFAVLVGVLALWFAAPVTAQERMWLQIEAQPNLNAALDRARAYAGLFPDVEGFRLGNGWYGVALGPQSREAAEARLLDLRAQNLIPADSYLADGATYGQRVWPVGAEAVPELPAEEQAAIEVPALPEPEPEETLRDSRAAEDALNEAERIALQEALKWYGFYDAALDGSFGKGTRASMAAWQEANGFEATGVLSTKQRAQLTGNFAADKAEFGFETVAEAEAGIEITLPMRLIQFDRYEPPFVHYAEKDGSGLRFFLISEPGGAAGLAGLYDVLQSLEIVPPAGERALEETSFTIRGANAKIETLAYATVDNGNIKGYLMSWNRADSDRMARILPVLQSSLRSLGDQVLDPGLVPLSEAAKRGLLTGLDVRHPKMSRTGFFIDSAGSVLTTAEAVTGCGKIMLERATEATMAFTDGTIAVLTPATPLSPTAVAGFAPSAPRPGTRATLSGYSYEDKLPAPVVTLGVVEEIGGLKGEPGLTRLTLETLPGDTGGPVLGPDGAVLGMLLPADLKAAKQLPEGVVFAASAQALSAALTAKGLVLTPPPATAPNADGLTQLARGMTVLVSCWE